MLSTWNSISGPKVEHLWLSNCHPYFRSDGDAKSLQKLCGISRDCVTSLQFTSFREDRTPQSKTASALESFNLLPVSDVQKCLKMSGKLIISEMEGRNPGTDTVSKLYILGRTVICSVVFYKRPWITDDTDDVAQCSCLSIMVDSDDKFSVTFDLQRIIDLHLRKAASVMQRSLVAPSLVAEEVTTILSELCEAVCSVLKKVDEQPAQVPLFSRFQTQIKFLSRAISSHLQTCGFSVVTGDTKRVVCQLAQILLLFNTEQERLCSEAHARFPQTQYFSGLNVQAIPRGRKEVFLPDVVFRDYPLSVIDADWQKVRQTLADSGVEYNSNLLKTVTGGGSLIPRFLEDIIFLEENGQDTRSAVKAFCAFLHTKAVSLVKMCEKYRSIGQQPAQKKMMTLLNIDDINDLKTLMGCAEKLQPGISSAIL